MLPTTYYAETSGVGLAILNHPARPGSLRVGALGLGVGVIAAYGQPGDVFRFYEINPAVIDIAKGQGGYFSFLKDTAADVQIMEGDARTSLERELANGGSQGFDLLVLDTTNGDAMPLHLLTKEAFTIYLQHLKPGGIVAVNVSNRYFDLSLEVYRLADALDLDAALIEDHGVASRAATPSGCCSAASQGCSSSRPLPGGGRRARLAPRACPCGLTIAATCCRSASSPRMPSRRPAVVVPDASGKIPHSGVRL